MQIMTSSYRPRSEVVTLSAAFISDAKARQDYLTLWYFLETLRAIRTKVSDPLLGEIRLKWWQEALQSSPSLIDRDPLLIEIKRIIIARKIDILDMVALIEAQFLWLSPTLKVEADILAHSDQSEGLLVRCGAAILGIEPPSNFHYAIRAFAVHNIASGIDNTVPMEVNNIYLDLARQFSNAIPYQLLPLIMPSLVQANDRGLLLRLKLLKIYMFGA